VNVTHILQRGARWWGVIALATVLLKTTKEVGNKEILTHVQDVLLVLVAIGLLILMLTTPIIIAISIRHLGTLRPFFVRPRLFARVLLAWLCTDIAGSVLFMEALRIGEFSIVGPLRNTGTLFSFVIGYYVLGQKISWRRKLAGSFIIVIGALLLSGSQYSIHDALPAFLAMLAAALFAVTAMFERVAVDPVRGAGVPPSIFAYVGTAGELVAYSLALYALTGSVEPVVPVVERILSDGRLFLFVVVSGALAYWLGVAALVHGELVQVSAVFRLGVLTTMFSGAIFFQEDISDKIVGGLVLFAGVVFVALPSRTKK